MRPREHDLIDPEVAEQLDAIDATLAGDPVEPRFAELAELALMLSVARPEGPRPEFAAELDQRVKSRFGRVAAAAPVAAAASSGGRGRGRRSWSLTPVLGLAGSALAAVVVAVAVVSGGGSGSPSRSTEALSAAPTYATATTATTVAGSQALKNAAHAPAPPSARKGGASPTVAHGQSVNGSASSTPASSSGSGGGSAGSAASSAGSGVALAPAAAPPAVAALEPVPNGRKIVQSSSLQLGTPARRMDTVAQELFTVVGNFSGIVDSSSIASTGGPDANAQFHLRIPSGSLALALSELSRLRYATVVARTDNTHDVNSSFVSAERQIADAKAAIVNLRVKLAAATIETEILSLRAQIANENAVIKQAQASLRSLNRRVDYSRVDVSIQASTGAAPSGGGGGSDGFGLHQAGHDALRVLEVSAGIALIVLAVLVPIGLLAALGWWVGLAVQRRRRERTLDLA